MTPEGCRESLGRSGKETRNTASVTLLVSFTSNLKTDNFVYSVYSTYFIFNPGLIWRRKKTEEVQYIALVLQEFKFLILERVPSF